MIGACVLVAVLLAVFASDKRSGLEPGKPVPHAKATNAMFEGIPEHRLALGAPSAPVTLVEFGDLQCPQCAMFADKTLPTLVSQYVRDGALRIVFKPLDLLGTQSLHAARIAVALSREGKMWPFVDLMYENQGQEGSGYATSEYMHAVVGAIRGASYPEATRAAKSSAVNTTIARSAALASKLKLTATPSFLLGRTGARLPRFRPVSVLEAASFTKPIEALLSEGD